MERLKRNPAAWGLILGGAVVLLSAFLVWLRVQDVASGSQLDVRAVKSTTGQTILFLGILAAICGGGVLGSGGRGKYAWATLGLIACIVVLGLAIYGLVDAAGLATRFATAQAWSELSSSSITYSADNVKAAFADGSLSASIAFGLLVGLVGSALGALGALLCYRYTPPGAD